jgi:hypothetical protein
VSLAAAPRVERMDQWLEPEDHIVTMEAAVFAPFLSQYRAPSRSGVVVRKVWPSVEAAVTWPLVAGAMLMVFMCELFFVCTSMMSVA